MVEEILRFNLQQILDNEVTFCDCIQVHSFAVAAFCSVMLNFAYKQHLPSVLRGFENGKLSTEIFFFDGFVLKHVMNHP